MTEKETPTTEVREDEIVDQEQDIQEQEAATEEQESEESTQEDEFQKELKEAKDKYLYLLSDFENFKRNAAKERMDLISTAGRDIMAALLPILDDFDRAEKNGGLPEGINLIHQKLNSTLEQKGLKPVGTKIGDDFNADLHEAVAEIPAPDDKSKGKIVDIVEPGYILGERIIRYAKVVVGK